MAKALVKVYEHSLARHALQIIGGVVGCQREQRVRRTYANAVEVHLPVAEIVVQHLSPAQDVAVLVIAQRIQPAVRPSVRAVVDDKDVGPAAIAALARKYGVGAQVIYHTNRPDRCREWKRLCPEGKSNLVLYGDLVAGMERLAKADFEGIDRVLLVVKVDASKRDFIPASAELKKAIAIGHRHGVFVNVFVGGEAGARAHRGRRHHLSRLVEDRV